MVYQYHSGKCITLVGSRSHRVTYEHTCATEKIITGSLINIKTSTFSPDICLHVLQEAWVLQWFLKVRKRGKIRNQYNQAPHLTQDTNGKVTTSQLDITNESQEVSPFTAGDHMASINRRARKHNKIKTEIT